VREGGFLNHHRCICHIANGDP